MKRVLLVLTGLLVAAAACAETTDDLVVGPADLRIEQSIEGGYHLWIRQKPGMQSVLLTESTEDPDRKSASYAYRTAAPNPVNGEEQRLLNGEFLKPGHNSIIDSTPEPDAIFGPAFHVFIPYVLQYGYAWSRQGEVQVLDGAYLSVRAFEKPYADYRGAFHDNPFILRVTQRPLPGPPEGNFMPDTVKEFAKIAEETKAETIKAVPDDLMSRIGAILEKQTGATLDLVLALDTTQSMEDDIPILRRHLVPLLRKGLKGVDSMRVGVVLYRDYMEEYLTKGLPFEKDLSMVQRVLDGVRCAGGRDLPEAVYEALYAAVHNYAWTAENRLVILVGDAPPHPIPRGAVTQEMVFAEAREKKVEIFTIILPQ
jgi:hypothetical protein